MKMSMSYYFFQNLARDRSEDSTFLTLWDLRESWIFQNDWMLILFITFLGILFEVILIKTYASLKKKPVCPGKSSSDSQQSEDTCLESVAFAPMSPSVVYTAPKKRDDIFSENTTSTLTSEENESNLEDRILSSDETLGTGTIESDSQVNFYCKRHRPFPAGASSSSSLLNSEVKETFQSHREHSENKYEPKHFSSKTLFSIMKTNKNKTPEFSSDLSLSKTSKSSRESKDLNVAPFPPAHLFLSRHQVRLLEENVRHRTSLKPKFTLQTKHNDVYPRPQENSQRPVEMLISAQPQNSFPEQNTIHNQGFCDAQFASQAQQCMYNQEWVSNQPSNTGSYFDRDLLVKPLSSSTQGSSQARDMDRSQHFIKVPCIIEVRDLLKSLEANEYLGHAQYSACFKDANMTKCSIKEQNSGFENAECLALSPNSVVKGMPQLKEKMPEAQGKLASTELSQYSGKSSMPLPTIKEQKNRKKSSDDKCKLSLKVPSLKAKKTSTSQMFQIIMCNTSKNKDELGSNPNTDKEELHLISVSKIIIPYIKKHSRANLVKVLPEVIKCDYFVKTQNKSPDIEKTNYVGSIERGTSGIIENLKQCGRENTALQRISSEVLPQFEQSFVVNTDKVKAPYYFLEEISKRSKESPEDPIEQAFHLDIPKRGIASEEAMSKSQQELTSSLRVKTNREIKMKEDLQNAVNREELLASTPNLQGDCPKDNIQKPDDLLKIVLEFSDVNLLISLRPKNHKNSELQGIKVQANTERVHLKKKIPLSPNITAHGNLTEHEKTEFNTRGSIKNMHHTKSSSDVFNDTTHATISEMPDTEMHSRSSAKVGTSTIRLSNSVLKQEKLQGEKETEEAKQIDEGSVVKEPQKCDREEKQRAVPPPSEDLRFCTDRKKNGKCVRFNIEPINLESKANKEQPVCPQIPSIQTATRTVPCSITDQFQVEKAKQNISRPTSRESALAPVHPLMAKNLPVGEHSIETIKNRVPLSENLRKKLDGHIAQEKEDLKSGLSSVAIESFETRKKLSRTKTALSVRQVIRKVKQPAISQMLYINGHDTSSHRRKLRDNVEIIIIQMLQDKSLTAELLNVYPNVSVLPNPGMYIRLNAENCCYRKLTQGNPQLDSKGKHLHSFYEENTSQNMLETRLQDEMKLVGKAQPKLAPLDSWRFSYDLATKTKDMPQGTEAANEMCSLTDISRISETETEKGIPRETRFMSTQGKHEAKITSEDIQESKLQDEEEREQEMLLKVTPQSSQHLEFCSGQRKDLNFCKPESQASRKIPYVLEQPADPVQGKELKKSTQAQNNTAGTATVKLSPLKSEESLTDALPEENRMTVVLHNWSGAEKAEFRNDPQAAILESLDLFKSDLPESNRQRKTFTCKALKSKRLTCIIMKVKKPSISTIFNIPQCGCRKCLLPKTLKSQIVEFLTCSGILSDIFYMIVLEEENQKGLAQEPPAVLESLTFSTGTSLAPKTERSNLVLMDKGLKSSKCVALKAKKAPISQTLSVPGCSTLSYRRPLPCRSETKIKRGESVGDVFLNAISSSTPQAETVETDPHSEEEVSSVVGLETSFPKAEESEIGLMSCDTNCDGNLGRKWDSTISEKKLQDQKDLRDSKPASLSSPASAESKSESYTLECVGKKYMRPRHKMLGAKQPGYPTGGHRKKKQHKIKYQEGENRWCAGGIESLFSDTEDAPSPSSKLIMDKLSFDTTKRDTLPERTLESIVSNRTTVEKGKVEENIAPNCLRSVDFFISVSSDSKSKGNIRQLLKSEIIVTLKCLTGKEKKRSVLHILKTNGCCIIKHKKKFQLHLRSKMRATGHVKNVTDIFLNTTDFTSDFFDMTRQNQLKPETATRQSRHNQTQLSQAVSPVEGLAEYSDSINEGDAFNLLKEVKLHNGESEGEKQKPLIETCPSYTSNLTINVQLIKESDPGKSEDVLLGESSFSQSQSCEMNPEINVKLENNKNVQVTVKVGLSEMEKSPICAKLSDPTDDTASRKYDEKKMNHSVLKEKAPYHLAAIVDSVDKQLSASQEMKNLADTLKTPEMSSAKVIPSQVKQPALLQSRNAVNHATVTINKKQKQNYKAESNASVISTPASRPTLQNMKMEQSLSILDVYGKSSTRGNALSKAKVGEEKVYKKQVLFKRTLQNCQPLEFEVVQTRESEAPLINRVCPKNILSQKIDINLMSQNVELNDEFTPEPDFLSEIHPTQNEKQNEFKSGMWKTTNPKTIVPHKKQQESDVPEAIWSSTCASITMYPKIIKSKDKAKTDDAKNTLPIRQKKLKAKRTPVSQCLGIGTGSNTKGQRVRIQQPKAFLLSENVANLVLEGHLDSGCLMSQHKMLAEMKMKQDKLKEGEGILLRVKMDKLLTKRPLLSSGCVDVSSVIEKLEENNGKEQQSHQDILADIPQGCVQPSQPESQQTKALHHDMLVLQRQVCFEPISRNDGTDHIDKSATPITLRRPEHYNTDQKELQVLSLDIFPPCRDYLVVSPQIEKPYHVKSKVGLEREVVYGGVFPKKTDTSGNIYDTQRVRTNAEPLHLENIGELPKEGEVCISRKNISSLLGDEGLNDTGIFLNSKGQKFLGGLHKTCPAWKEQAKTSSDPKSILDSVPCATRRPLHLNQTLSTTRRQDDNISLNVSVDPWGHKERSELLSAIPMRSQRWKVDFSEKPRVKQLNICNQNKEKILESIFSCVLRQFHTVNSKRQGMSSSSVLEKASNEVSIPADPPPRTEGIDPHFGGREEHPGSTPTAFPTRVSSSLHDTCQIASPQRSEAVKPTSSRQYTSDTETRKQREKHRYDHLPKPTSHSKTDLLQMTHDSSTPQTRQTLRKLDMINGYTQKRRNRQTQYHPPISYDSVQETLSYSQNYPCHWPHLMPQMKEVSESGRVSNRKKGLDLCFKNQTSMECFVPLMAPRQMKTRNAMLPLEACSKTIKYWNPVFSKGTQSSDKPQVTETIVNSNSPKIRVTKKGDLCKAKEKQIEAYVPRILLHFLSICMHLWHENKRQKGGLKEGVMKGIRWPESRALKSVFSDTFGATDCDITSSGLEMQWNIKDKIINIKQRHGDQNWIVTKIGEPIPSLPHFKSGEEATGVIGSSSIKRTKQASQEENGAKAVEMKGIRDSDLISKTEKSSLSHVTGEELPLLFNIVKQEKKVQLGEGKLAVKLTNTCTFLPSLCHANLNSTIKVGQNKSKILRSNLPPLKSQKSSKVREVSLLESANQANLNNVIEVKCLPQRKKECAENKVDVKDIMDLICTTLTRKQSPFNHFLHGRGPWRNDKHRKKIAQDNKNSLSTVPNKLWDSIPSSPQLEWDTEINEIYKQGITRFCLPSLTLQELSDAMRTDKKPSDATLSGMRRAKHLPRKGGVEIAPAEMIQSERITVRLKQSSVVSKLQLNTEEEEKRMQDDKQGTIQSDYSISFPPYSEVDMNTKGEEARQRKVRFCLLQPELQETLARDEITYKMSASSPTSNGVINATEKIMYKERETSKVEEVISLKKNKSSHLQKIQLEKKHQEKYLQDDVLTSSNDSTPSHPKLNLNVEEMNYVTKTSKYSLPELACKISSVAVRKASKMSIKGKITSGTENVKEYVLQKEDDKVKILAKKDIIYPKDKYWKGSKEQGKMDPQSEKQAKPDGEGIKQKKQDGTDQKKVEGEGREQGKSRDHKMQGKMELQGQKQEKINREDKEQEEWNREDKGQEKGDPESKGGQKTTDSEGKLQGKADAEGRGRGNRGPACKNTEIVMYAHFHFESSQINHESDTRTKGEEAAIQGVSKCAISQLHHQRLYDAGQVIPTKPVVGDDKSDDTKTAREHQPQGGGGGGERVRVKLWAGRISKVNQCPLPCVPRTARRGGCQTSEKTNANENLGHVPQRESKRGEVLTLPFSPCGKLDKGKKARGEKQELTRSILPCTQNIGSSSLEKFKYIVSPLNDIVSNSKRTKNTIKKVQGEMEPGIMKSCLSPLVLQKSLPARQTASIKTTARQMKKGKAPLPPEEDRVQTLDRNGLTHPNGALSQTHTSISPLMSLINQCSIMSKRKEPQRSSEGKAGQKQERIRYYNVVLDKTDSSLSHPLQVKLPEPSGAGEVPYADVNQQKLCEEAKARVITEDTQCGVLCQSTTLRVKISPPAYRFSRKILPLSIKEQRKEVQEAKSKPSMVLKKSSSLPSLPCFKWDSRVNEKEGLLGRTQFCFPSLTVQESESMESLDGNRKELIGPITQEEERERLQIDVKDFLDPTIRNLLYSHIIRTEELQRKIKEQRRKTQEHKNELLSVLEDRIKKYSFTQFQPKKSSDTVRITCPKIIDDGDLVNDLQEKKNREKVASMNNVVDPTDRYLKTEKSPILKTCNFSSLQWKASEQEGKIQEGKREPDLMLTKISTAGYHLPFPSTCAGMEEKRLMSTRSSLSSTKLLKPIGHDSNTYLKPVTGDVLINLQCRKKHMPENREEDEDQVGDTPVSPKHQETKGQECKDEPSVVLTKFVTSLLFLPRFQLEKKIDLDDGMLRLTRSLQRISEAEEVMPRETIVGDSTEDAANQDMSQRGKTDRKETIRKRPPDVIMKGRKSLYSCKLHRTELYVHIKGHKEKEQEEQGEPHGVILRQSHPSKSSLPNLKRDESTQVDEEKIGSKTSLLPLIFTAFSGVEKIADTKALSFDARKGNPYRTPKGGGFGVTTTDMTIKVHCKGQTRSPVPHILNTKGFTLNLKVREKQVHKHKGEPRVILSQTFLYTPSTSLSHLDSGDKIDKDLCGISGSSCPQLKLLEPSGVTETAKRELVEGNDNNAISSSKQNALLQKETEQQWISDFIVDTQQRSEPSKVRSERDLNPQGEKMYLSGFGTIRHGKLLELHLMEQQEDGPEKYKKKHLATFNSYSTTGNLKRQTDGINNSRQNVSPKVSASLPRQIAKGMCVTFGTPVSLRGFSVAERETHQQETISKVSPASVDSLKWYNPKKDERNSDRMIEMFSPPKLGSLETMNTTKSTAPQKLEKQDAIAEKQIMPHSKSGHKARSNSTLSLKFPFRDRKQEETLELDVGRKRTVFTSLPMLPAGHMGITELNNALGRKAELTLLGPAREAHVLELLQNSLKLLWTFLLQSGHLEGIQKTNKTTPVHLEQRGGNEAQRVTHAENTCPGQQTQEKGGRASPGTNPNLQAREALGRAPSPPKETGAEHPTPPPRMGLAGRGAPTRGTGRRFRRTDGVIARSRRNPRVVIGRNLCLCVRSPGAGGPGRARGAAVSRFKEDAARASPASAGAPLGRGGGDGQLPPGAAGSGGIQKLRLHVLEREGRLPPKCVLPHAGCPFALADASATGGVRAERPPTVALGGGGGAPRESHAPAGSRDTGAPDDLGTPRGHPPGDTPLLPPPSPGGSPARPAAPGSQPHAVVPSSFTPGGRHEPAHDLDWKVLEINRKADLGPDGWAVGVPDGAGAPGLAGPPAPGTPDVLQSYSAQQRDRLLMHLSMKTLEIQMKAPSRVVRDSCARARAAHGGRAAPPPGSCVHPAPRAPRRRNRVLLLFEEKSLHQIDLDLRSRYLRFHRGLAPHRAAREQESRDPGPPRRENAALRSRAPQPGNPRARPPAPCAPLRLRPDARPPSPPRPCAAARAEEERRPGVRFREPGPRPAPPLGAREAAGGEEGSHPSPVSDRVSSQRGPAAGLSDDDEECTFLAGTLTTKEPRDIPSDLRKGLPLGDSTDLKPPFRWEVPGDRPKTASRKHALSMPSPPSGSPKSGKCRPSPKCLSPDRLRHSAPNAVDVHSAPSSVPFDGEKKLAWTTSSTASSLSASSSGWVTQFHPGKQHRPSHAHPERKDRKKTSFEVCGKHAGHRGHPRSTEKRARRKEVGDCEAENATSSQSKRRPAAKHHQGDIDFGSETPRQPFFYACVPADTLEIVPQTVRWTIPSRTLRKRNFKVPLVAKITSSWKIWGSQK